MCCPKSHCRCVQSQAVGPRFKPKPTKSSFRIYAFNQHKEKSLRESQPLPQIQPRGPSKSLRHCFKDIGQSRLTTPLPRLSLSPRALLIICIPLLWLRLPLGADHVTELSSLSAPCCKSLAIYYITNERSCRIFSPL